MEGWKNGRTEEWKDGRLEGRKSGRVEEGKDGRVEGWKSGRMEEWKGRRREEWKNGRLEGRKSGRREEWVVFLFLCLVVGTGSPCPLYQYNTHHKQQRIQHINDL